MAIGDSLGIGSSLSKATNDLNKSSEKLASGKRVNRAQDDAAGLAIISALEADVRTATQASRNSLDGISISSIADAALGQISDITTRQAELAAQSANGTLSDTQRQTLNEEYQQLEQQKGQIIETSTFNGVNVFEGTSLQVGIDGSTNSQLNVPGVDAGSVTAAVDISTAAGAQGAIDTLKAQTQNIASVRGEIGASVSRIEIAQSNAESIAIESEAAASRIRDVDVAEEAANRVGAAIRQQVGVALAAQSTKLDANIVAKLIG